MAGDGIVGKVNEDKGLQTIEERTSDSEYLEQRVGAVGRTGRGRHTTRHTTLLTLPNGGIVADTPGESAVFSDSCCLTCSWGMGSYPSLAQVHTDHAANPGFNQPALETLLPHDVGRCFPEVRALLEKGQCTFNDCRHLQVCCQ